MKLIVRGQRLGVDGAVRTHITRRIRFGLGRLSPRILRVAVQFVDLNGPRGGEDKACRIEVRLLPTGRVFVEETDADLYAAADRAADRVARSVCRAIERRRDLQRDPTPPGRSRPASTPPGVEDRPPAWGRSPRARPD